jgi:selenocysteine-specific elongation factor
VERHVVIGTAGHIDHGKTALVKALTGVDTDRLAEEKARGITIDLGFAPLELDGAHASIVDVPGHEGFIRNMVAGATGVDLALLVVAVDEGVMPQTREHLAILRHLGVERGVVALTKTDLAADADWRALVAEDVAALVASELGGRWPAVEVSAVTGAGLDRLRAALAHEATALGTRATDDRFRLPVDRVFALAGAGTIVTGTVWSGSVAEGEIVRVLPAGAQARVRSIQVHGAAAPVAGAGSRAALALVGLAREQAERGAVVVTGDGWRASRWLDAAVSLAPDVALKVRTRVHLHHGTAVVVARVARLGESATGVTAMRLALDTPLVARAGDRFVLRSWSPVTTIGGGVVVDPWAERQPLVRRRDDMPGLRGATAAEQVAHLVRRRGATGMTRTELEVAAGLGASALAAALDRCGELGVIGSADWFVSGAQVEAAAVRMVEALGAFHAAHPLEPGMSAQAWRGAARSDRRELLDLAEARALSRGQVLREGGLVRRPDWDPAVSTAGQATAERVLRILEAADAEPPSVADLAAAFPEADVPAVLRMLARAGRIVPVAERYYEAGALGRERERLVAVLRELGAASPAGIRERLGRSRKWLIPLLEWADRQGVTVRDGDRRTLRDERGA